MTPIEALKLALSTEIESLKLYNKLSGEQSAVKDIFSFLINEEYRHKELIEKKIVELTR